MLAELHGKFESDDGVPADRSEDLLTDAVFGALRYLRYGLALAEVFRALNVKVTGEDLHGAQVRLWPTIPMPAWPGTLIEPDVLVIAGSVVVVFEAKLFSPFSFSHDPAQPDAELYHQLAVQYAATKAWASGLRLSIRSMVAVTADATRPNASLDRAVHDIERLTGAVTPGVVRWLPGTGSLRYSAASRLLGERTGAIVLNGARVGRHSMIAAGTVLAEGQQVPEGVLVAGVPGKVRGEVRRSRARGDRAQRRHVRRAIPVASPRRSVRCAVPRPGTAVEAEPAWLPGSAVLRP